MAIVLAVVIVGWVAAALIGTQAYFLGEQSKPIHERNWNSESFEKLAKTVTGRETDFGTRTPVYGYDAFSSQGLEG
ncbi:MAG: photosystem II protein, Psb35-related [Leptolyngbyaceae cyanobacterium]